MHLQYYQQLFTEHDPELVEALRRAPKTYLLTGVAGFIASHIAEALLALGQKVIGVDNFATGSEKTMVSFRHHPSFKFFQLDIRQSEEMAKLIQEANIIIHHAALTSVPLSIEKPQLCHEINIDATFSLLQLAQKYSIEKFVYASSSSVYGDLKAREEGISEHDTGTPLSFYAAAKRQNEFYAHLFTNYFNLPCVGFRYFNIFGPRQSASGDYASVIPRWINRILKEERSVVIYGDGSTVRDYCPVENVVYANLLAVTKTRQELKEELQVYNVGLMNPINLNQLFMLLKAKLHQQEIAVIYEKFRQGDIPFSMANTELIQHHFGFKPIVSFEKGLAQTLHWYQQNRENEIKC